MHIFSFKNSTEYFSWSCVAIAFQNILNLNFSQGYAVRHCCQGPEGTNNLSVPDQPPLGTPATRTHPSRLGPAQPGALLHAWPCCRSACLQLCLARACVQPWTPLIQNLICGLISFWPGLGPSSSLWPAQQSLGCLWPWLPAPGPSLICWLGLLAKPLPCLTPWSFLVTWTFCWSWLPSLAVLRLPCSGAEGWWGPCPENCIIVLGSPAPRTSWYC